MFRKEPLWEAAENNLNVGVVIKKLFAPIALDATLAEDWGSQP
jgi:hypothetical protein